MPATRRHKSMSPPQSREQTVEATVWLSGLNVESSDRSTNYRNVECEGSLAARLGEVNQFPTLRSM
jgi:hypothetical protein